MSTEAIINYTISIVSILIGIFISYYFYAKSKESKEPNLYYQSYLNIKRIANGNQTRDIKVFYKSEEVNRVTTTYVWFWNEGKRPILKSDIPESSDLNLVFSDEGHKIRILDYRLVKQSRNPVRAFVNKTNDTSLKIEFDFLDYQDGVVVEVQHTGGPNVYVKADGIILGNSEGVTINRVDADKYVDPSPPQKLTKGTILIMGFVLFLFWIFMGLVALYLGVSIYFPEKIPALLRSSSGYINLSQQQLVEIIRVEIPEASEESIQAVIDSAAAPPSSSRFWETVAFIGLTIFFITFPFLTAYGFMTGPGYPFPVSLTFEKENKNI